MDKKEIMSVWAAFQEVQEKKNGKLDPVGKEDGDVDNDGDEDSSDEYLANRRKKVGASMKKESSEESPYPSLDKKKREKKGSNLEDAGGPAAKLKGESVEEGNAQCPKCDGKGKIGGKECGHCEGKGWHVKEDYQDFLESLDYVELEEYVDWLMEEEQLDELSSDLLNRASNKAQKKSDFHAKQSTKRDNTNSRIAAKHGSTARHSGASFKAKTAQNKNFSKAGSQYDKHLDRKNQADKFSAAAKKKSTSEAWEMINSVLESRQLDEVSSEMLTRSMEGRVKELKKVKQQEDAVWDKIIAAEKKGNPTKSLHKESEKLTDRMEVIRSSILKLQSKIKHGKDVIATPQVRQRKLYGKAFGEDTNLFSAEELAALEEKMKQPNDSGSKGEEFMSTSSPKEKKVMADHEAGSEKKYEDWEETSEKDGSKAGRAVKSQSPVRRGESRKSEPMGKVKGS